MEEIHLFDDWLIIDIISSRVWHRIANSVSIANSEIQSGHGWSTSAHFYLEWAGNSRAVVYWRVWTYFSWRLGAPGVRVRLVRTEDLHWTRTRRDSLSLEATPPLQTTPIFSRHLLSLFQMTSLLFFRFIFSRLLLRSATWLPSSFPASDWLIAKEWNSPQSIHTFFTFHIKSTKSLFLSFTLGKLCPLEGVSVQVRDTSH